MIFKKDNSKNYYVVYNYKTPEGKWKKQWIKTETDDEDEAREIERRILNGLQEAKSNLKKIKVSQGLEQLFSRFISNLSGEVYQSSGIKLDDVWNTYAAKPFFESRTPRTKEAKKIIWNKFHTWIKNNYPACNSINDIPAKIANEYLIKNYSKKSTTTYNNQRHNLSQMWKELSIDSNLQSNIWENVSMPARKTAKQYRRFTNDEIKLILKNASGFWKYASIISYYTGLRQKDIVYLEWPQIDLKNKVIRLIAHKVVRYHKTNFISIHNDLAEMLKEIPRTDSKYLFPATANKRTFSFRHEFGKILTKCGIADNETGIVGFHSWRVSFVTGSREAGISLEDIRKFAGHTTAAMTEHYDHSKGSKKINKLKSITKGEK